MDKAKALSIIIAEAARGELVFPANVAASLNIQKALDDPDCSSDAASKMVLTEPLLSARVVAIANSVAYSRSGHDVTNVKSAVARIGFRTLRALIASLVVRQLAGATTNPRIRSMTSQLWLHSAQVAALSQVIARRVTKVDPETALFAGIVHEVGGFYLLSRAEEFPSLLDVEIDASNGGVQSVQDDTEFPDTVVDVESAEATIGRTVLANLTLPQEVVEAVEAVWYGMRAMPPESLGDTLLLANDLAYTRSPLEPQNDSTPEQLQSVIDFVVGDGTLNDILQESQEEVKSLTAALMV